MNRFDVVIIGASPATYRLASTLKDKKKKVALISLPEQPETLQARTIAALIKCIDVERFSDGPAGKNIQGLHAFSGNPVFLSPTTVQVSSQILESKWFVIASGVRQHLPPIQGLDQTAYKTPITALTSPLKQESVVVLGAGPLGVATALQLAHSGNQVTLITKHNAILVNEDIAIQSHYAKILENENVTVVNNTHLVQSRAISETKLELAVENEEERSQLSTQSLVIATGLIPNTKDLQLKHTGTYVNQSGFIVVNEEMRTSQPTLWALGSVTGTKRAFAAEDFQADIVSANIDAPFFCRRKIDDFDPLSFDLPGVHPLSRVGLTEEEASTKHKKVFSAVAVSSDENEILKLVGKKNGELVGIHAAGPQAQAMGLYFGLAMRAGVLIPELLDSRFLPPLPLSSLILRAVERWQEQIG